VLSYVELGFRVSIWECKVLSHDVPGFRVSIWECNVLSHIELGLGFRV